MNKISSLARIGIAHRCFGNPIPQAAYDLIEATEKCVEDFNPPNKLAEHAPELLEVLTYGQTLNLPDMLDWVADRFVNVHGENGNLDFILSLRERARMSRAAINKALGETK